MSDTGIEGELEPDFAPETGRVVDGYAATLRGQLAALDTIHQAARIDAIAERGQTQEARETLASIAVSAGDLREVARGALIALTERDARGIAEFVGALSSGLDLLHAQAEQGARGVGASLDDAARALGAVMTPADLPPSLFDTPANRNLCLALQEAKLAADAVADERRSYGNGAAFLLGGLLTSVTNEIYGAPGLDSMDPAAEENPE